MSGGSSLLSQFSGRASNSPSASVPVISRSAPPPAIRRALVKPRLGVACDGAFGFQFLQHALEQDAVGAFQAQSSAPDRAWSRRDVRPAGSSRRALSRAGVCCRLSFANFYSPATGSGFFLALLAGLLSLPRLALAWQLSLAVAFTAPSFRALASGFGAWLSAFALAGALALASFSFRRPWPRVRRSAPAPVPGHAIGSCLRARWHWSRRR